MENDGRRFKEDFMSKASWKPEGQRRTQEGKDVWTTDHEVVFIDGLGTHSFSRMPRLEMLRNYLVALNLPGPLRCMDKKFLRTYVKNSIAVEEAYPTQKHVPQHRLQDVLEDDDG
jgi:hypothetical protein